MFQYKITRANLFSVNFPKENLTRRSDIDVWVKKQVDALNSSFSDGINIDFETDIMENETDARDGFTYLIKHLAAQMKENSVFNMVRRVNGHEN